MNNQDNNKEKLWKVISWVGMALFAFLIIISIKELKTFGYSSPMMNTISVSGKGEAIAIPDIATFSFTASETAKTVLEAKDKSAEKVNKALEAVKKGGVLQDDIKTISYNINPKYEYSQGICNQYTCSSGKQVLIGYEVSQIVEVKIRDLSKAGELFDSIVSAGIQMVGGLSFGIDDIDFVKAKAREDAILDARQKALKIAKELDVKLVKITGFYDQSGDMPIYSAMREGMVSDVMSLKASITPEIPKGEQKVISNVSITYEIR